MQEHTARSDDRHAAEAHHQPRHGPIGTTSCLKHAGVGGMSPPQARETITTATAAAAAAADQSSSQMQSASFQANSTPSADQPRKSQTVPASEAAVEFVSAFSGASQLQAEDELRRQSGSSEQGVQDLWPETCSWTVPCHVYKYRTVTFNFEDPSLPGVLQPAINVSFLPLCYDPADQFNSLTHLEVTLTMLIIFKDKITQHVARVRRYLTYVPCEHWTRHVDALWTHSQLLLLGLHNTSKRPCVMPLHAQSTAVCPCRTMRGC